jgi:hypothetical protein
MTDTTYSEPIGIVATVFRAVFFLILDHWMVSSLWIGQVRGNFAAATFLASL